jgi:hypothetical protein
MVLLALLLCGWWCCVAGSVAVIDLNATNYVKLVSSDTIPWLVLFRNRRIVDMELDKGVRNVASRVDSHQLHVGVVDCENPFCKDAFGIVDTPVLVLFHSGVWSVGECGREDKEGKVV